MDIKVGQKVTIPKDLRALFGGVHTQIAIGAGVLTVDAASHDWIVFRDKDGSPWYINFDRSGYAKAFLQMINYV